MTPEERREFIADIAAAILLGQTTGVGGFTNISVEDCYGESAGDKFAFMDIKSYDIHDIRICGWRHSQVNGTTDSVVRYRGSASAADTSYAAGRAVAFVRNGNAAVEI